MATEETQAPINRLEGDLRAFGEEEDVTLSSLFGLATLIRDLKISIDNDLHLVVGVGVYQRLARVETVKSGTDWSLRREFLTAARMVLIKVTRVQVP